LREHGEAFGGGEKIAAEQEFADFVPINFASVEPESDPSTRANVSGQVVALRLGGGQGGVFSKQNFASDGDDAITVVVVQEAGEGFSADEKSRMRAVDFALCLGKSKSELG